MSTYDHSRVAQFIGESFRTPSTSEQGVTAIIGGNTLEKAPSGPVTDFVKQHGGHTVITKVRRVEMACAEGFSGRGRGPGGIRSRRGKRVMRRACHAITRVARCSPPSTNLSCATFRAVNARIARVPAACASSIDLSCSGPFLCTRLHMRIISPRVVSRSLPCALLANS